MTFAVAAAVFILDRVTKLFAVKIMHLGDTAAVIPNVFHFTLVANTGAAFGLLKGRQELFVISSAIVSLAIIIYTVRNRFSSGFMSSALGLILGGALGNLTDRLKFGYVIDFFDFRIWPVFNIADSCITIGIALLVINYVSSSR